MCGISAIIGDNWGPAQLEAMVAGQAHRGPDMVGTYRNDRGKVGLGHRRLSIIDVSDGGRQPMSDSTGRYRIIFNGEVYNYLELRAELCDYPYRTRTDTEVILAAFERWGERCLERFIGMFAFVIWDELKQTLFAARDRFGVKPLYYFRYPSGTLYLASEIKAIHAAGIPARRDEAAWATYLVSGLYDHGERTFWDGICSLPAGHRLTWKNDNLEISCWYDLTQRIGAEFDERPVSVVCDEYLELLTESVRLRFRADVPVGINLSGGLDSSLLLGLVQRVQGPDSDVKAFTFITGDPRYDELPWVRKMLERTLHPLLVCRLTPEEVPALAESVQTFQDEPFAGIPTLAYAKVFEEARAQGVLVLLDGQGMDEQWAGYDYYLQALHGSTPGLVQGTKDKATRPECLTPEFAALSVPFTAPTPFSDGLRNAQYRDVRYSKIPRALRFNDRISMRSSTELREPFLDHRLVELAFRQPPERKISDGARKWMLRKIADGLLPNEVAEAPKRPVQTPQREWLRGPLRKWAEERIHAALDLFGGAWLDRNDVMGAWSGYCDGRSDNSFYIWQWISLGLKASLPR